MRSASYVVNGLEKVFRAILNARHWETACQKHSDIS